MPTTTKVGKVTVMDIENDDFKHSKLAEAAATFLAGTETGKRYTFIPSKTFPALVMIYPKMGEKQLDRALVDHVCSMHVDKWYFFVYDMAHKGSIVELANEIATKYDVEPTVTLLWQALGKREA